MLHASAAFKGGDIQGGKNLLWGGLDNPLETMVQGSKPLGVSKVNRTFCLFEVDQMSTRNFWEVSGKK